MKDHFSPSAWAAWQTATVPPEMKAAMQAHLQAGCEECGREQGFWALLGTTLRADREPVPEAWTARALALADHAAERLAGDGPRLTFDNFAAPALAVRGPQSRRFCVYELRGEGAASASLEIMTERLGRAHSDGDWSVIGQVLTAEGEGWRDCVVELTPVADGFAAARARSNAAGEFSFVQAGDGPWRLDVQAGHQRWGVAPVLMP